MIVDTLPISRSDGFISGCAPVMEGIEFSLIRSLIDHDSEVTLSTEVLGGRGHVVRQEVPGIGPVVLKQYHRGGVMGKVNPSYYLRLGASRPAREFELLNLVRSLDVNAPEPLMWLTRGGMIYQGWLLMREIPHIQSLAQAETRDVDSLEPILRAFAEQVEKLILAGVYHVDLHPGNVLIGHDNCVSIIDFDKARQFRGAANKLRDLYLCRWRRAVIKHGLPDYLAEYVCAFLRKNFALNRSL